MKQIQVENRTTPETIKPSTPTPHHLRRHDLSYFDLLEFPKYMNTIVYFSFSSSDSSKTRSHISNTLKTSLAEILSIYYPLAGRIGHNNMYVDCKDQGAHYQEANVKGSLTNAILSELDPSEMLKFLPYDTEETKVPLVGEIPLLLVQVNFFECGGLVIGLLMNHKVADGASLFTFLKNWASVARKGVYDTILPDFGAAKLFPPVDPTVSFPLLKEEEHLVTRRFVFSNDTILGLCRKYSTCGSSSRPSRVEALTAFIWKRFIASTQVVVVAQPSKTYRLLLVVNLRPRFDPPLKPSAFGNMTDMIVAIDTCPNEDDHCKLVKNMRTLISSLSDPENIKLYRNTEQLLPMIKEMCEWVDTENDVWVLFSSYIRLYELRDADFGWGPPSAMHVYAPTVCPKNYVVFMDSNDGNGIDAWMSFSKEDMAKFEVDPELLAHAC